MDESQRELTYDRCFRLHGSDRVVSENQKGRPTLPSEVADLVPFGALLPRPCRCRGHQLELEVRRGEGPNRRVRCSPDRAREDQDKDELVSFQSPAV